MNYFFDKTSLKVFNKDIVIRRRIKVGEGWCVLLEDH